MGMCLLCFLSQPKVLDDIIYTIRNRSDKQTSKPRDTTTEAVRALKGREIFARAR
jgi:hypothetical protein